MDENFEMMVLSQEEREKFENDFRYLIDRYIHFFDVYYRLLAKIGRSPEEELEFQTVHQLLLSIGEVLSSAIQSFGDDLFGKSMDIYYQFKQLANEGDRKAQNFIKQMRPILEASLKARINKN